MKPLNEIIPRNAPVSRLTFLHFSFKSVVLRDKWPKSKLTSSMINCGAQFFIEDAKSKGALADLLETNLGDLVCRRS